MFGHFKRLNMFSVETNLKEILSGVSFLNIYYTEDNPFKRNCNWVQLKERQKYELNSGTFVVDNLKIYINSMTQYGIVAYRKDDSFMISMESGYKGKHKYYLFKPIN